MCLFCLAARFDTISVKRSSTKMVQMPTKFKRAGSQLLAASINHQHLQEPSAAGTEAVHDKKVAP